MAPRIATEQAVFRAADEMVKEGREPSVLEIRERVGGGSFSTVKQNLEAWRQARVQVEFDTGNTPPLIEQKGLEFARLVWAQASQQAQCEAQEIKRQAQSLTDNANQQLTEASVEIERLEQLESDHIAEIERLTSELRLSEIALAEANILVSRTADLERRLEAAHTDMKNFAQQIGQLGGENATLRNQVRLMAATKTNAKRRRS